MQSGICIKLSGNNTYGDDMMLVLLLLAFVPIHIYLTLHIDGKALKGKITLGKLLPLRLYIYNMQDSPLEVKLKLLGKEYSLNRLYSRHKAQIDYSVKKYERRRTGVIELLSRLKQYVRLIDIEGKAGIRDRADTTAIIVGTMNALLCPFVYGSKADTKRARVVAIYGRDEFEVDTKCIISLSTVNIIVELLGYYLKRRRNNGQYNRGRNERYAGQN